MREQLPYIKYDGTYNIITLRLASGELTDREISIVLNQIKAGDGKFYHLVAAQVMLEHFDMVVELHNRVSVSQVMKGIVSASSGKIAMLRREPGKIWRDDYTDKLIKDQRDLTRKLKYMFQSPVRLRLVKSGWEWIGWYLQE